MCPIDLPTDRKKGVMRMELFKKIIDSLEPHKDRFEALDIFGLGEPLLDPMIFDRIKYVKDKGFPQSVGFSTNADLLSPEKQKKLLESGLDIVIFSIDGINAETHESIRPKTNFHRATKNVLDTIHMRNEGNHKTRFLVRFIRQDANRDQWEDYKTFWKTKLDFGKGDFITAYNMHNWGGECGSKEETLAATGLRIDPVVEKKACHKPFQILVVLADGTVPLCDEDFHHGKYKYGNANDSDVLEIFNSPAFNKTRELHRSGNKTDMEICKNCTVPYSEPVREIINNYS